MPARANVKRKLKRSFRRRRRNIEQIGGQADRNIDRLLFRRLNRLSQVRRFVGMWLAVIGVMVIALIVQTRSLSTYFQQLEPAPGGIYSEGIVGLFTNANPLYANGAADTAVSQIIFPGLFKFDEQGKLAGDLASSYQVDAKRTTYTVRLKSGLTWQDGKPFTAADVVFTYKTIQNPEAQSPLFSSWQSISVAAVNSHTVSFTLSNPLSSFPYALTNGIVPQHLLSQVPTAQLRSATFNTNPVGMGAFKWRFITVSGSSEASRRQQINLVPFAKYWQGPPKLDALDLLIFSSDQQMIQAFKDKQVNAMSGLDSAPADMKQDGAIGLAHVPLNALVMAFFNNSGPVLGDKTVRRALVESVNQAEMLSLFGYPPRLSTGPFLPSQAKTIHAAKQLKFNLKSAAKLLNSDGWKLRPNGVRYKNGKPLELSLASENTPTYVAVSQFLQQQWSQAGVKIDANNLGVDDLQGSVIPNHDYDILLYGITIGADPDIFAYWDSSQAGTDSPGHFNLSEYKSSSADQALEAARIRSPMSLRTPKYRIFSKLWAADAPAISLYQPNYLYVSRGPVYGFSSAGLNSGPDRFDNVANWEIRTQRVTRSL